MAKLIDKPMERRLDIFVPAGLIVNLPKIRWK